MAEVRTIPARRVVVTGIGLICGVGNTAPAIWDSLMAGKSGMAEITAFALEGHPVRFAAEVKDFDIHKFVDKKEARKMGRFIHFRHGRQRGSHGPTPALSSRMTMRSALASTSVSGIGGFDVMEREHTNLMNGGPRKISPFFIPATIVKPSCRPRLH